MDLAPSVSFALDISDLDDAGFGIGCRDGDPRPIRVWGATLGDRVRVTVIHRSPHRLVGRIEALLKPGLRRSETCPHRPDCGGCPQFEAQPGALHDWRMERMKRALPDLPLRRGEAKPLSPWRSRSKWNVARVGGAVRFTVPKPRSDEGLAIPNCPIVPQRSRQRLALLAQQLGAAPLDSVHGLVLTEGRAAGNGSGFGIGLVSKAPMPELRPAVGRPGDSVAWLHSNAAKSMFFAGDAASYSGPPLVGLPAGNTAVPTPPFAFAQAHPEGRDEMLGQLLEWAALYPTGRAVDLGSGSGIFARALARAGWLVDAVEPSPHARPAWTDAAPGVDFHPIGAEEFRWNHAPDLVVVDPPRAGLNPAWSEPMLAAAPKRIVAIHCGHRAAVRDLTLLLERGYKPRDAVLLDLFPGSTHGELMSLWEMA